MCDYGRLNFDYLQSERRLLKPAVRQQKSLEPVSWSHAIETVAAQLKRYVGRQIAILASGRMTNEELWLTARLAKLLGTSLIDIVPHTGAGDDILLSEDRNPNTNGARLLRVASDSGTVLQEIKDAVSFGHIKALISLGENPGRCGISPDVLSELPVFIIMDLLSNENTGFASCVLPSLGFAEKRGSMINGKGRLQRLNRATRPPGNARDDWEILRDLLQATGGGDSLHSIEDVFRRMSETVPQFAGLSLSKIGDLGVQILEIEELPPTHPSDEEAIEQAIAVQATRRSVRHDLDHAQAHPEESTVRQLKPEAAGRR